MEKYRAIPQGYMTVGQVAKKMDVTVRALQHYDKEGLLSPSAVSDGGRRLYTDKDIIKLHQILSLKHLGFSLDDIRDRLIPLDAPADVAQILSEQAAIIREKIAGLTESLSAIETLKTEVLEMQSVDFNIRSRFDKESGIAFLQRFFHLQDEAIRLQEDGVSAESQRHTLCWTDYPDCCIA